MTREMLNLTERREGMRSGGMETRILGMLSMSVVAERMRVIVWIWKAGRGGKGRCLSRTGIAVAFRPLIASKPRGSRVEFED